MGGGWWRDVEKSMVLLLQSIILLEGQASQIEPRRLHHPYNLSVVYDYVCTPAVIFRVTLVMGVHCVMQQAIIQCLRRRRIRVVITVA